jgi:hypothetical protein
MVNKRVMDCSWNMAFAKKTAFVEPMPRLAAISNHHRNRDFLRSSNGFLIAGAGFALLSCGDALIKSMTAYWPVPAIAAMHFTLAIPLPAVAVHLQLPVALAIDALVFGHFPDATATGGTLLIICAGLSM